MDCVTIDVLRRDNESWGIQIAGEEPCYIETIDKDGPAAEAGLEVGDYLISINGISVYDASQDTIVELIKECGKVARFRILPNQNTFAPPIEEEKKSKTKPQPTSAMARWKNAFNQSDSDEDQEDEDEDEKDYCDSRNLEDYCSLDKKATKETTPREDFDFQVRYDRAEEIENRLRPESNKKITVEQSNFIVTPENQKQFDEHYHHEGNFAGRRATVAGAFTGDFNVIRSTKEYEDIVGVKSRVLAGIQHFSLSEKNDKIAKEDRGKIILYTTSLGIHRSVAYKCEEAKKIISGFRVKFEVRDVYNDPQYKEELLKRLGLASGDAIPALPKLYIDGVCAGGFDEIQEMSDCGDLRIRLQDFPKYNIRRNCPTCQASGEVMCLMCKGMGYRQKNRFTTLKCGNCNQRGVIKCPDCL